MSRGRFAKQSAVVNQAMKPRRMSRERFAKQSAVVNQALPRIAIRRPHAALRFTKTGGAISGVFVRQLTMQRRCEKIILIFSWRLFLRLLQGVISQPLITYVGVFMWWSSFQTAQACFFVKVGMISREMTKFPVALAWFLSKKGCFPVEWQNFRRHWLVFCQISRPAPSLQKIHPFYPSIFCK